MTLYNTYVTCYIKLFYKYEPKLRPMVGVSKTDTANVQRDY